jgi:hypothetical protein
VDLGFIQGWIGVYLGLGWGLFRIGLGFIEGSFRAQLRLV